MEDKLRTSVKKLKKYQKELLEKPQFTQKKATKIVKKIAADVFRYQVQRERIMRPYILDIYIKSIKAAIEIDGGIHEKRGGYDNKRDQYLWKKYRVSVYRFDSREIDRDSFRQAIWEICIKGTYSYLAHIKKKAKAKNVILPLGFPVVKSPAYFEGFMIEGEPFEDSQRWNNE